MRDLQLGLRPGLLVLAPGRSRDHRSAAFRPAGHPRAAGGLIRTPGRTFVGRPQDVRDVRRLTGDMSFSLRAPVARRLAVAAALSACLLGLASARAQPAAAGSQPLDLRVSVSLAPGSGVDAVVPRNLHRRPAGQRKGEPAHEARRRRRRDRELHDEQPPRLDQRLGQRHAELPRLDRHATRASRTSPRAPAATAGSALAHSAHRRARRARRPRRSPSASAVRSPPDRHVGRRAAGSSCLMSSCSCMSTPPPRPTCRTRCPRSFGSGPPDGSRPRARAAIRIAWHWCSRAAACAACVSAGMAAALERLGLTASFDLVVGSSAGAINGGALIAGVAGGCVAAYHGPFASRSFVNPARVLWGRPVIDVDYVLAYDSESLDAGAPRPRRGEPDRPALRRRGRGDRGRGGPLRHALQARAVRRGPGLQPHAVGGGPSGRDRRPALRRRRAGLADPGGRGARRRRHARPRAADAPVRRAAQERLARSPIASSNATCAASTRRS